MVDPLKYLADQGATFVKVRPRDKRPQETGWQNKPLSLDEITPHIRAGGNVGLLTGQQSNGICVLDLDTDFQGFCQQFPELAESPQIVRESAPDRGKVLIRIKGRIPHSRSWTRHGENNPRIELLADGRQGVMPPSTHPDGQPYIFRNLDKSLIELTVEDLAVIWKTWTGEDMVPQHGTCSSDGQDHLISNDAIGSPSMRTFNPAPPTDLHRSYVTHEAYARKAFADELDILRGTASGARNHQLNRSAYNLGQLVGAGVLDEHQVSTELQAAAEAAGLSSSEAKATIRSGLAAGMRSPRSLPELHTVPARSAAAVNATLAPKSSAGDSGGSEPSAPNDSSLDRLRAILHAVPLGDNGKRDRDQVETAALTLIEAAAALTQADLLRLQSDLKQLGATAKFVDQFSRAVRDARQRIVLGEATDDDLPKPDGWPYASEFGRTFLLGVQTDKNGSRSIVRRDNIAEFQAQIVEEMISEDGQRRFVIAGNTAEGASFRLEISAAEFADERALKAALTSAAGARAPIHAGMARHVGPAIQLLSNPEIPQVRRYERTGWTNSHFLIPGLEREDTKIVLPDKLVYDISGGTLELGLQCLRLTCDAIQPTVFTTLFSYILTPPMALGAGWRSDRYVIVALGMTGNLKTTTVQHVLCTYGRRFQEDDVLIKWGEGATTNALMKMATHAHDMPMLFDNFKTSTGRGSRDFVNFTHNVVEGGEKDRLNRASQLREARPVNCWPLLTAEDIPESDPASQARLLVVKFRKGTVDPVRLAQAQALAKNLPAVGARWINWLESSDGERHAQWAGEQFPGLRQKWANHLQGIDRNAVNRMRLASNLAINQLAYKVACFHPDFGSVLEPLIPDHHRGLKQIAEEMIAATSQGTEAQRFLSVLRQLLASKRCRLVTEDAGGDYTFGECVGLRRPDGIYIFPDVARAAVAKVLGDAFFDALSSATLYKQLAELDVIASFDTGRHTKTIRYDGTRVTTLHLKWSAMQPNGEAENGDEEDGNVS